MDDRFARRTNGGTHVRNGLTMDTGNAHLGYIFVGYKPSSKKLKLRISKLNQMYTYDLNQDGRLEVFPLQMGDGTYRIALYRQTSGSKYAQVASHNLKVQMKDEFCPFLHPNQYVMYGEDSNVVPVANELCEGLDTDIDKANALIGFVANKFLYDHMKALTVKPGYLPDVDRTLDERRGICFDLAALTCCLLRLQGIPSSIVVGNTEGGYHAWNRVFVDGAWERVDVTAKITNQKYFRYTAEGVY